MRQAGVYACLIIRALLLVVELQRELDIPRGLSAGDLPHRGVDAGVWDVELNMVEEIDEVSSELQLEPLRKLEVLMDTQIYGGEMR